MADHRADTRAVSRRRPVDATGASAAPAGGLHRANESRRTHSGHRKTLFRGIPSAPTLVGVSAVALAAVGALSASSPAAGSAQLTAGHVGGSTTGHASAFSGTSDVASASVLAHRREQAVSRDSQRDALRDAADEKLQAVAEKQAKERNAALAQLAASAEKQAGLIARNAWQLPVTRGAYHLTSRFGQCSGLWSHCHTGLDFAAPSGTPIHAIAGGTISETASAGAYGNRTIETLADGTELWYCHQTSFSVRPGQKVRAGQLIGSVGATGNTTGPHVHVEVRPGAGDPVDPDAAMRAHGLKP